MPEMFAQTFQLCESTHFIFGSSYFKLDSYYLQAKQLPTNEQDPYLISLEFPALGSISGLNSNLMNK